MPSHEKSLDIAASPETVWSVLADPVYVPKLYPDILSAEPSEPGLYRVGTKVKIIGKVAGRKVHINTEIMEVEPNRKIASKQAPGGILKTYKSTTTLEPSKKGSKVTQKIEYEASAGYLGKALSALVVNRAVGKNIEHSLNNLKEIAELKDLPKSAK